MIDQGIGQAIETRVSVDALLAGTAVPFRGSERSAIAKRAVDGAVIIGPLGLAGDEQADADVHGGPGKAIHHYPFEHYAEWRAIAPHPDRLAAVGAFGENISTNGLTEENVCVGDRFRVGSAIIEVSQPRQPCWKQAHHLSWPTLPRLMTKAAKAGWYYRVIEPGTVQAGDALVLLERPEPDWPVAHVFRLLMHRQPELPRAEYRALTVLGCLDGGWRAMAQARCAAAI